MAGKNQIIETIQNGTIKAQENYNKAAYSPLIWAPEYMIDVHIFQELHDFIGSNSLTLQHNLRNLKSDGIILSQRGRKLATLPDGAKIDVILWYRNTAVIRAFIEVKKYASDSIKDIKRVCKLIKNNQTCGILASGIHGSYDTSKPKSKQRAIDNIRNRISNIENRVISLVNACSGGACQAKLYDHDILEVPIQFVNKSWVWMPVCFLIEHH
jgi:hypothetical protein